MYTHFWRSAPHPALTFFDAPEATTACTHRNRSNTPLQALTMLNDKAFFEFAQGLAMRILSPLPTGREGPGEKGQRAKPTDSQQIPYPYRLCLAWPPMHVDKKPLPD